MSNPLPKPPTLPTGLTVKEFYAWCQTQPGRYELVDGEVVAQAAETVRHALTKRAVERALQSGIDQAGLNCTVYPDGVSVRVSDDTAYEPDAVVRCGDPIDLDALDVPEPVILVEVLSPSTRGVDLNRKLIDYFKLPSVAHYLVVDPERKVVVHHQRDGDGVATRMLSAGELTLSPPGMVVDVDGFWVE